MRSMTVAVARKDAAWKERSMSAGPRSGFLRGLKNADVEAWRGLYAQFGGMIYRLARGMVGATDAEDVTQEAILQAFRKRTQFRGECEKELETWLYRIALNKCRDWCRKRQCRPVFVAVPDLAEVGMESPPIEDRLDDIDLGVLKTLVKKSITLVRKTYPQS